MVETPFNKRDYDRFGIPIFLDNGFDIEVWEITPITRRAGYQILRVPDPVSYEKYRVFFLKKEVIRAINNCGAGCLIISYVIYQLMTLFLFKAISRVGVPYCEVIGGSLPVNQPDKLPFRSYIIGIIKSLTVKKLSRKVNHIISNVIYKQLGIQNPSFIVVTGGETAYTETKNIKSQNSNVIKLHSFDYDIYMCVKNKESSFKEGNYAVFLDEYVPFHPDYVLIGLEPYSCAEDYYPLLCNYFDNFENQHGFEVVIAAHPRSAYENCPDYFNGRRIIRNRTAELVKSAKVALLHGSTSVNFAVLFRKPMIFSTTDTLNSSPMKYFMEPMCAHFNKTQVNINLPYSFEQNTIMPIDDALYEDYIYKYIKTKDSPEVLSWETFADTIADEFES